MEAFKWNKHFITGLNDVDNQHEHLVNLVNKLGTMVIENNFDESTIHIILNELVDYTTYHFDDEQKIMSFYKLDKRHISKHNIIHQNFIKDIQSLVSEEIENIEKSGRELFDYLMYWLAYHILGIDQEMAKQIDLIKSGAEPAEAYNIITDNQSNIAEPLLLALKGLFYQVSQKNAKLLNLNKTLEKKVYERTKELQELNKNLEEISFTDQLTGIRNRRYAIETLIKMWVNSVTENLNISCLMIDIDNFKSVNDLYGHDVGDTVIKTIAKTLQSSSKEPNIVCRLGGDEFIIICPEQDKKDAILLSEKILNNVSSLKIETGDSFWNGSVSIGISTKNSKTKDYEELIKAADINVYEAKRAGKNCIRY